MKLRLTRTLLDSFDHFDPDWSFAMDDWMMVDLDSHS